MFTMTRELKNALREHFIHQKLEISYAIFKPFPFFEGLRDKSFITDKMYMESLDACRNMVPVSKVVHNILTKLEDSFQPSLLEMLFSQINLREYPNLKAVLNSFRSVFIPYGGSSAPSPFEAAANPAMRSPHHTLLPLPAPLRHPIPMPKVSEPRAIPQPWAKVLGKQSSPAGPAKDLPRVIQKERITPAPPKNDEESSQQMSSTPPATVQVSSDNLTPETKKKEGAQKIPHVPPARTPVIINYSPKPKDLKEAQEAPSTPPVKKAKKRKRITWSAAKRKHLKKSLLRGTASAGHKIQKKRQVVDQTTERKDDSTRTSEVVTSAKKTRTECAQTSGPEEISDDSSEMDEAKSPQDPPSTPLQVIQDPLDNGSKLSLGRSGEKKKKRKACSQSSSNTRQRKRLPKGTALPGHRIQKKHQVVDQESQRKDDSTSTSKIMTRARTKKAEGVQTSGPEEKKRKTDICKSSKKTHQKNIPQNENPEDETADLQSLNFPVTCGTVKGVFYPEKMKIGSSGKCIQDEKGVWLTPYEFEIEGKGKKSKDWKRSVRCGEKTLQQLTKEGLMIYPPRISLEREILDYGEPFKESMWLDLVKERLTANVYTVAWFIRDTHLIFHNHKTFHKASNFGHVGLDLETKFEKALKETFIFHEA